MCVRSLPFIASGERKHLSWKKFWYISISSHPKLWQEIRRRQPSWYYQNLCMDRSYETLNVYIRQLREGELWRGGSLDRQGQGLARRGSHSIFEQPGLSVAEKGPSNVTWRSSAWCICSHSRRLKFPMGGQHGQGSCLETCLHHLGPKAARVRSSWKFQIGGGVVFLAAFFTKTKSRDGIWD